MSTIYHPRELGEPAIPHRVSAYFERCWRETLQWCERRRLRSSLDYLSDRELRDIGVTRGEIDHLARAALSGEPRELAVPPKRI